MECQLQRVTLRISSSLWGLWLVGVALELEGGEEGRRVKEGRQAGKREGPLTGGKEGTDGERFLVTVTFSGFYLPCKQMAACSAYKSLALLGAAGFYRPEHHLKVKKTTF